jgi:hypothetical protein
MNANITTTPIPQRALRAGTGVGQPLPARIVGHLFGARRALAGAARPRSAAACAVPIVSRRASISVSMRETNTEATPTGIAAAATGLSGGSAATAGPCTVPTSSEPARRPQPFNNARRRRSPAVVLAPSPSRPGHSRCSPIVGCDPFRSASNPAMSTQSMRYSPLARRLPQSHSTTRIRAEQPKGGILRRLSRVRRIDLRLLVAGISRSAVEAHGVSRKKTSQTGINIVFDKSSLALAEAARHLLFTF